MECKIDKYLLYEYLDKTIDPLEKIFLEQHLKDCIQCRKDITQMKLVLWEMDEIRESEIEVPPDIYKVREAALSQIFEEGNSKLTVKDVVSLPLEGLKLGGEILNCIPAVKSSNTLIKTGAKYSSKIISSASSKLLSGRIKILKSRTQE